MHGQFVSNVDELRDSVRRFMEEPELWREAIGSHPRYFVHLTRGASHLFGLSKFCAFRGASLEEYVAKLRHTTDGHITQKHIRRLVQKPWVPFDDVPGTRERDSNAGSWASRRRPTISARFRF